MHGGGLDSTTRIIAGTGEFGVPERTAPCPSKRRRFDHSTSEAANSA
jgi:hypothetical protein